MQEMQEEEQNYFKYEKCGAMIVQSIKQHPAHYFKIETASANHLKQHRDIQHSQKMLYMLKQNIHSINRQKIQGMFVLMMEQILSEIQLKLKKEEGNWKNFKEFRPLIEKHLDRKIYPLGFTFSKVTENKSLKTPGDYKNDEIMTETMTVQAAHADQFFTSLFQVMSELLTTMKQFYGYDEDQQMQIAISTSLIIFMENNQSSFIAKKDKLSLSKIKSNIQQEPITQQKNKENQLAFTKVLFDVLDTISNKSKVKSEKPGNNDQQNNGLISTIFTTVATIPSWFSSNPTNNEKLKLRQELTSLLKKQKNPQNFKLPQEEMEIINYYINLDSTSILEQMTLQNRKQFIEFVSNIMTEPDCQQFLEETKAHEELASIVDQAYTIKNDNGKPISKIHVVWIILLYKAFEQNYCPSRRSYLLDICRNYLNDKAINSKQILKVVQSFFLFQSQILKEIRKLPAINQNKKQFKKLGVNNINQVSLLIEHQLHRIHLFELKKKFQKPALLEIDRLTNCSPRKNITFLFSGFLSEDSCKVGEWNGMIESGFDSEMFSLRWESKSAADMLKFVYQTGISIAGANLGISSIAGGPYLRAAAIVKQIYTRYQTNPFNPAFECAQATGQFLAELLISSFQGHFINLVGFSLGTELIYSLLKRLQERKHIHLINKVFLMGGAADKNQIQKLLRQQKHILRIVNMYSGNDSTLKYLLKICKPSIVPIGLNPLNEKISKHKIKNIDATDLVTGHLAYRDNLKLIEMMMNIHDY